MPTIAWREGGGQHRPSRQRRVLPRDPQTLLRLLANASVLAPYRDPPLTNAAAWDAYTAFLTDDRIVLRTDEPAGLEPRWRAFARHESSSPKLWMDAYLAAFASSDGARMVTTDTAFRQFGGLDLLVLG